ncbi:Protein of unknown function [Pyronema omphalodes CBS 100304]|uniref:Uncharacterized protein n=1 Tax=Pyronema omphalodes (strain CBS 100304) TaxID=1076935 RepID=U4LGE8_PYROM|nr:Protein of unknown function [Pyronema omphalodes CBS 100304]
MPIFKLSSRSTWGSELQRLLSLNQQNHLDILDTSNQKSYTIPLFEINYRNFDSAHLSIVFQRSQIDKMMKRFQSLALEHAELLNSRRQKRISTSSTQMHIAHKTRRVEGCGHQPAAYFEAIKHLPHSPDNPKAFSSGNSSPNSADV